MKTKIVEYFAYEIYCNLREIEGECAKIRNKTPSLQNSSIGAGLDMQCLIEKLDETLKLINLLTKKNYIKH